MSSSQVHQLEPLSTLFAQVLSRTRPTSVAILGVAGGNGLEHINPEITHRVLGIDFHPDYLAQVQARYPQWEMLQHDLTQPLPPIDPFDLVYAALVLEHTGLGTPVENALALLAPGATLAVVLQLPSTLAPGVSTGTYASIQQLGSIFRFIDPDALLAELSGKGLNLLEHSQTPLASGKALWLGLFRKP